VANTETENAFFDLTACCRGVSLVSCCAPHPGSPIMRQQRLILLMLPA
jgi:hypothetical protein